MLSDPMSDRVNNHEGTFMHKLGCHVVPGVHPQILADQLTLSHLVGPPDFQTFLRPCISIDQELQFFTFVTCMLLEYVHQRHHKGELVDVERLLPNSRFLDSLNSSMDTNGNHTQILLPSYQLQPLPVCLIDLLSKVRRS